MIRAALLMCQAPASGDEGHYMVFQEPEIWKPIVERFLSTLGG